MAIDAGTVYYTVDADTQKAIDSAAEMNKSLDSTKGKMSGLDTQVSKTSKAVNSGLSSVGRSAGQAGIQIQQFIGQIQGGQSAMLALSQQSADLGFVLGAPLLGAVVGIGASLVGMLLPSLMKTTDALGDVEKATERVKAALTLSSEGITGYSDNMKVLAQVSDQLARVKLANIIADQANAMKVALKGVGDTFDDAFDRPWRTYESNVENLFGNASYSAFEAAAALRAASGALSSGIDDQKIEDLASALERAKTAGINNTDAGRQMVSVMTDLIAQYKLGEITISQLKKQLDGTTLSFEDQTKSVNKWTEASQRLTIQTEKSRSKQLELEKAITLKRAAEEKATPETLKSIESSYDKMIANAKEAESEKALAKSKRDRAAAERDSKKASKDFIKNFGDEDFSTNADTEATGFSRTITSTYDEETALERLDRERNLIQMYQELEIGDAQAHADAIKAIDQEIADEKKKALDDQVKEQRNATNAQLNIYSQLFSGMQSLTSNMLASMDEQSSGYKAMFAVNKAFAVAQAIVSAELAAAQVLAHDAGIMGMSAAATSNAIRAMGYASAGVIAGTAIAGGRLYGGSVQANGMYRINENGAPEVFNAANGQQYMLPNTRGEVVSNKDASGSGSTVIQVNISSDGAVSTDGGSMMAQFGKEIGQFVDAKFKQLQSQSMRQGGALWQYKQNG
ncbi:hypothetical protein VCSRO111_0576 [Vibrio cholerae]|uniref:hypothetical protein n=1 Tax=Vibrio cholerae TaxID=666 RepID=UPI0011D75B40|nr:hypothetical protein [Vibrio cholerae]TXY57613.1 hypothetical protein FXE91_10635 [Vibrio cholerae]GHX89464.1 hypothetical protein VCSRO111_0576 [Vibrio cholerae]